MCQSTPEIRRVAREAAAGSQEEANERSNMKEGNPVKSGTLTRSGVWEERRAKPFRAEPLGALQTIHLV